MRHNPTETLRGWGLEPVESKQELIPIAEAAIGLQNLLEQVATQSQLVGHEVFELISRADMINLISGELEYLGKTLNEAAAITFMRNLFGEPQDGAEGAIDVYMQLASDEIDWQSQAKKEALMTREIIRSQVDNMLILIQRTIITKLAEIQNEIERREKLLEEADQATQEHKAELQSLFDEKRKPVDTKLTILRAEEAELSTTSNAISYIAGQLSRGVEQSIRPILEKPVGPTLLRPELAA